jgi:hypothetical protein
MPYDQSELPRQAPNGAEHQDEAYDPTRSNPYQDQDPEPAAPVAQAAQAGAGCTCSAGVAIRTAAGWRRLGGQFVPRPEKEKKVRRVPPLPRYDLRNQPLPAATRYPHPVTGADVYPIYSARLYAKEGGTWPAHRTAHRPLKRPEAAPLYGSWPSPAVAPRLPERNRRPPRPTRRYDRASPVSLPQTGLHRGRAVGAGGIRRHDPEDQGRKLKARPPATSWMDDDDVRYLERRDAGPPGRYVRPAHGLCARAYRCRSGLDQKPREPSGRSLPACPGVSRPEGIRGPG